MNQNKNILKNKKYLEVSYNSKRAYKGTYPNKLAQKIDKDFFKAPGKILDVGCGNGDFLEAFSNLGYEVSGVDISPDLEERLGNKYSVYNVDIENDACPFENQFDYVFSKSVIEHTRNPDAFLAFINKALKPGGICVIMAPSWEHTYWGPFYIDHTHVTPFTLPSLMQAMELSDFENINGEYFYQLPFVWKSKVLKIIPYIISKLPIPYSPFYQVPWSGNTFANKMIRFSKEVMLLTVGVKKKNG